MQASLTRPADNPERGGQFAGSPSGYGAIVRIERVIDAAAIADGAELFDEPPTVAAVEKFLRETTHPDKGTEMFVYELGVAPFARKRGIATELVRALAALAQSRSCYGMWVAVDVDNAAALATYRRAGAHDEAACVVQSWDFVRS